MKSKIIVFSTMGATYSMYSYFQHSPIFPNVNEILKAFVAVAGDGTLRSAILISLAIVFRGLVLAIAFGFTFGVGFYYSPKLKSGMMPVLDLMRPLSALALMPIFIVLFGLGTTVKTIMIFWTAWAPIVLNTYNGLKRVDRSVIEAARLDGASGLSLLIHIYIPCAFPFIMTGFNISISSGWISIVAAEMLGGNNGLGFMVLQCSETFRYGQMYVAILTIAGIGLVMSSIIQKTQERFYSEESNVVLGFGFVGGNGIRERRER